ncbi:chromosome segregation protein SMC [Tahibacter amnicola]|uniref:Chromosome partition protein Smc n=1 Tax=Tahibacter amnicola TaxID=2976241 RepID=A0ABY6BA38_9GAMM|nr:chromosome segregation protein SMC [Tahibacter amnicola]UXI66406.1 chromosome segregation protein SMC [Tahibacter amnicola]
MRLTTIKLAGFKSFVDPTTLHLPTNMTGIVGPNGCGKSNIIDAIRWVMGESAASRLRGDSLTDVIFSGSSARKPVSQASVELIFDNSDGTIVGEYAKFNEISVKRVVTRDGQSQYLLNGGRCRRRDITDLFLGTGLGARSYSIIEQGMISQVVESDPEALRHHLEEAAGISKYKERRKETESRIKSTRENLDRVRDVRDEVDKQLEHLNRQAKAAARWQELKAEQKQKEAELRALSYRAIADEVEGQGSALRQAETEIEKFLADQRQVEAQLEASRERHQLATEHLGAVQGEVYKVGADIARVEQQIAHNRQLRERLDKSREETDRAYKELADHIAADNEQIETLRLALADGEPKLEALREADETTGDVLRDAEAKLAEWQAAWDDYSRSSSEATQAAEVERTRLDYLDRQCLDISRRLETLENEKRAADIGALSSAAESLGDEQETHKERVETLTGLLDERKLAYERVLESERQAQATQNDVRQQLQSLRGRLSSLEALQHAALGQEKGAASQWLDRSGLSSAKRLGESLDVDAGWETAVETVLSGFLEGVLVDQPAAYADEIAGLREADMVLIAAEAGGEAVSGTLSAHARGPAAVVGLLAQIHTADSLDDARRLAATLAPNESVITRSGEWFGSGFVRVLRRGGAQAGVLAREREIQAVQGQIESLDERGRELADQIDELKATKVETERERDDAQRELYMAHRRLAEIAGQLQSHRGKMETAQARLEKVDGEITQLSAKLAEDEAQAKEARGRLDAAVIRMGDLEQRRQELDSQRRRTLEQREEARMNAREARDQAHQLALSLESKRSAIQSLEQALGRMQGQLQQLDARREEIAAQLVADEDPLTELDAERQTYLNQRLLVDRQLVEARRALEDCDAEFRRLEQERHRVEHVLTQRREALSERRLSEHSLKLRAQNLAEAIAEAGLELDAVLAGLPATADAGDWQQHLVELDAKIRRLEPVNLAAIQEYEEQSQRKTYLDAQLTDLGTALETLEGAIKKIDRETRQRFKETFDKVNSGLQELFPRLFGGGHAYLELTGEDLLDTGVSIMARPPGKRVTSISLLSGGEKALTAVALVFSIFRLNPAPFCLLDEVDAPLDEANVGRFSNMVNEMSEHVQFLFVSHNKTTMEAAHQLCGVTMREPGVSRLVQVDLAEASKLVGAA